MKHPRGCAIATTWVSVGIGVERIRGGVACSHALYREWVARRQRHEGERKEAGWRTRWWQLRRGPSLSCGGIDGQMGRVWRVGSGNGPFNSAWVVASARSADPTRPDYIFYKKFIYTYVQFIFNTKKHLTMIFYWLDGFTQCLPPFFH
jgi:hypothetical protein